MDIPKLEDSIMSELDKLEKYFDADESNNKVLKNKDYYRGAIEVLDGVIHNSEYNATSDGLNFSSRITVLRNKLELALEGLRGNL